MYFVGNIIKGKIRIDLVTGSYIKNSELMFKQPYRHSSDIRATVEVKKIVDAGGAYIILESSDNLSMDDIKK